MKGSGRSPLLLWVLVGLGIGAAAGFLGGLLRPHQTPRYAPTYLPPVPSEDERVTVGV